MSELPSKCDKCLSAIYNNKCACSFWYKSDPITDINEFIFECTIQEFESKILRVMKDRQNLYPSEKNDLEWKAFSEFIHKRNSGSLGEP